jgi:hypothetical protein
MSKVIQFNNKNQEEQESCCEYCDLTLEFMDYAKQCDNEEELFNVMRNFANEVSVVALKQYLEHELSHKVELLDSLTYGCCEDECDGCCGECDCEDEDLN